jgi:hypothetical protein
MSAALIQQLIKHVMDLIVHHLALKFVGFIGAMEIKEDVFVSP